MSAATQFPVPKDFPSILKALTRELLRSFPDAADQTPEKILEFGSDYFPEILDQIQEAEQSAPVVRMSIDEMRTSLEGLFQDADTDGSGTLSVAEFKEVMASFQRDGMELSRNEMVSMLMEADINLSLIHISEPTRPY